MSGRFIEIGIEGYHSLTIEEVWPDGDAPEEITADAVLAQLNGCGYTLRSNLDEWGLLAGLTVFVFVDKTRAEATT